MSFELPQHIEVEGVNEYDMNRYHYKEDRLNLQTRTYINSRNVREITSNDFLDNNMKIELKIKKCIIILFYTENTLSKEYLNSWIKLSKNAPGPLYGCINCLVERSIPTKFSDLNNEINHPLHWAGVKRYPFILVYRDGWPQAFYNGHHNEFSLTEYCLTTACNNDYKEKYLNDLTYTSSKNNKLETISENEEEENEDIDDNYDLEGVEVSNDVYDPF